MAVLISSISNFKSLNFNFEGKQQGALKASLLFISASHYKYGKTVGACCTLMQAKLRADAEFVEQHLLQAKPLWHWKHSLIVQPL